MEGSSEAATHSWKLTRNCAMRPRVEASADDACVWVCCGARRLPVGQQLSTPRRPIVANSSCPRRVR